MKKIIVNTKIHNTNAADLNALKNELKIGDEITIYKGFCVNENLALNDGDSVIFIKKGEMPKGEILREMMSARNSPQINAALKAAKIGIAGLGGLGSNVAIALARIGVGELKLVDFDIVEPSNLNRQQYFINDLGKPKTRALSTTIKKINPFVKISFKTTKINEKNANSLFENCDIIAECFDNPNAKAMLINTLKNKIIVAASGMAGYGKSNEIRTIKMAKNLFVCGDLVSGAKIGNGLMAPRVGICAMHQANKILEILIENFEKGQKNG